MSSSPNEANSLRSFFITVAGVVAAATIIGIGATAASTWQAQTRLEENVTQLKHDRDADRAIVAPIPALLARIEARLDSQGTKLDHIADQLDTKRK